LVSSLAFVSNEDVQKILSVCTPEQLEEKEKINFVRKLPILNKKNRKKD
jgi:hypothetical protein